MRGGGPPSAPRSNTCYHLEVEDKQMTIGTRIWLRMNWLWAWIPAISDVVTTMMITVTTTHIRHQPRPRCGGVRVVPKHLPRPRAIEQRLWDGVVWPASPTALKLE